MLTCIHQLSTYLLELRLAALLPLAQSGKSYSVPWAIVLFLVILGLLVTLSPARRTYEVKKPKDD